uniref:Uncharacterized protein n=2 Tax=Aegilops tauschii subsp. strangulata TaxID=200361 RepID=A0A453AX81_AEGTS
RPVCSPPAPALGWQQGCKPARRPAFRPICGLERYPSTSCILSAVSISMLMALCTRVLSLAYIITPTSTSSLPNLPVHHQRYSLLNAAMMALRLRRWAGAALSTYHLQALECEQVRCPYCEYAGSRVVHPAQGSFVGRGVELEKMWGGEELYSEEYTNDCIIACSREPTYWVDYLEDDCIYRSYRLDGSDEGEKMILKKGIPDAEEMKYLIEKGFLIIEDDGLS